MGEIRMTDEQAQGVLIAHAFGYERDMARVAEARATLDRSVGEVSARPGRVSKESADTAVAEAFGRAPVADGLSLRRDLVEAGLTEAGAIGVAHWVKTGCTIEEAVELGVNYRSVPPGSVPYVIAQRVRETLQHHAGGAK